MRIYTTFFALILFGLSSISYANGYISLGGGMSQLAPQGVSKSSKTSYKIAFAVEIIDNIDMEAHYASLGKTTQGTDYNYTGLGANYNIIDTGTITPFVGGGIAKFSSNQTINKSTQAYGTGGISFALDDDKNLKSKISYTKYASDASAVFFDIVQKF